MDVLPIALGSCAANVSMASRYDSCPFYAHALPLLSCSTICKLISLGVVCVIQEWGNQCVKCDNSQNNWLALFLVLSFAYVLLLHLTSQSTSGKLKVASFFVQVCKFSLFVYPQYLSTLS